MNNPYNHLPVLVTGGCGFIGSHIAEVLVELGAHVTIMDDLSTGSLSNIEHIQDKISFMHASITDKNSCIQATAGQQIIFHLAALISVPESIKSPVLCHEININGTFNILEAARVNHVKRVLLSSSSAVYGNTGMQCDERMACNPESPYGFSKRVGELLCQQYSTVYGLETVILRYFNVYGPRQNSNGAYAAVVAKFTEQMKNNAPIILFGDGLQTRDFINVHDVVQANITLATIPVPKGDIFNIATGTSITLLELINKLKQQYPHYTGDIRFEPSRAGDLKHSQADCTKYHRISQKNYTTQTEERTPDKTYLSTIGLEKKSNQL